MRNLINSEKSTSERVSLKERVRLLTFGVSAPAISGATIPGTVAAVLVMPNRTPA